MKVLGVIENIDGMGVVCEDTEAFIEHRIFNWKQLEWLIKMLYFTITDHTPNVAEVVIGGTNVK